MDRFIRNLNATRSSPTFQNNFPVTESVIILNKSNPSTSKTARKWRHLKLTIELVNPKENAGYLFQVLFSWKPHFSGGSSIPRDSFNIEFWFVFQITINWTHSKLKEIAFLIVFFTDRVNRNFQSFLKNRIWPVARYWCLLKLSESRFSLHLLFNFQPLLIGSSL